MGNEKAKMTTDLANLLETVMKDSKQLENTFKAALFFIIDKDGEIIASKQLGEMEKKVAELLRELPGKIINLSTSPIKLDDYVSDWTELKLSDHESSIGYLGMITYAVDSNLTRPFLTGFSHSVVAAYNHLHLLQGNERKSLQLKRTQLLLHVTKKFYASMNVGEVLEEITDVMAEVYPNAIMQIYISREWSFDKRLPIKQMNCRERIANSFEETAYLTGKLQIEDGTEEKTTTLYAPLLGRQAVYGVMKVQALKSTLFFNYEIEFIKTLAEIGGSALENAELYEQSKQFIHDLQLINDTSRQLNSNLVLSETVAFMIKQIKQSFNVNEVGFLQFHKNGKLTILEGSSSFFSLSSIQPFLREVSTEVLQKKEALFIADVQGKDYPLKLYRSFIAVPMVQNGDLKGLVIVLHEEPYYFSFNNFKLLQSLVHHSTLAFANSILHEELEKLVITDHLTRLYSRNYLEQMIQKSIETDAYGCFLLLDIDNFKQINDTYGHQVGDDVIIQVANIMKKNIRENDIAARWGGEELAIYLPKVEPEISQKIASRIVKTVSRETSPKVTVSCGASFWEQSDYEKSLIKIFQEADESLYIAKKLGKNRIFMKKK